MTRDETLLARIDERTLNISEKLVAHIDEDGQRFDRVFGYVKERFDKMDTKLDTLWDDSNKSEGAFSTSKNAVAAVWSVVAIGISYWMTKP